MFSRLFASRVAPLAYPGAPEGITLYVIGDIHGRDDLLASVHAAIDSERPELGASQLEIYLGDYVDRGPYSAQVVERLIARAAARHVILLRGNHEDVLQSFLSGHVSIGDWRAFGGLETCLSYGCGEEVLHPDISSAEIVALLATRVPARHLSFLATLQNYFDLGDYFFVHAGVRPGVSLFSQTSRDLLWIREPFLTYAGDFGRIVVHGHTPVKMPEFRDNRINIDTGAVSTGLLTCLRIDSHGVSLLDHA